MKTPTLLAEDDVVFSETLSRFLGRNGYDVIGCYSLEEAEKSLTPTVKMIFTDLRLPDDGGTSFLKQVKDIFPNLPVVATTSYAEISVAVEAMKPGALDYIPKPSQQGDMLNVVKNVQNTVLSTPRPETVETVAPLSKTDHSNPAEMVKIPEVTEENPFIEGVSSTFRGLSKFVSSVVPTDVSVLTTGESGTGKKVVVKLIYLKSEHRNRSFITVDCGVIPREIASSEFFEHVKGPFIGAVINEKGHFKEANGGAIFLDEMGDLSYENQIQLLRALQERRIKPIGNSKEIEVNTRVLAAANGDLLEAVSKGDFREDLYHRSNELVIKVPSLSERKDDLMISAPHLLGIANEKLHKNVQGLTGRTVQKTSNYNWSGNPRGLSNVVKRAILLTTTGCISESELPDFVMSETRYLPTEHFSFSTKENEHGLIIRALRETDSNKTEAARLLGFTRKILYNKLKAYNIEEF